MKLQLAVFTLRWLLNSLGIWIAVRLFGTGYDPDALQAGAGGFLLAGLIFSLVNSILRPFFIVLSLPAILISLGLFTFIVNGFLVYISLLLTPGIQMKFWHSVLAGIILSLINYIVSSIFVLRYDAVRKES